MNPEIPDKRYFKIGEVAVLLGVKPHIIRYWVDEFPELKPEKTKSGQRLFQRRDLDMLFAIHALVQEQQFTVAGARDRLLALRKQGVPIKDLQEAIERFSGAYVVEQYQIVAKERVRQETLLREAKAQREAQIERVRERERELASSKIHQMQKSVTQERHERQALEEQITTLKEQNLRLNDRLRAKHMQEQILMKKMRQQQRKYRTLKERLSQLAQRLIEHTSHHP